jgi:hypothetical protein
MVMSKVGMMMGGWEDGREVRCVYIYPLPLSSSGWVIIFPGKKSGPRTGKIIVRVQNIADRANAEVAVDETSQVNGDRFDAERRHLR